MLRYWLLLFFVFLTFDVCAFERYAKYLDVDLDEKLPDLKDLEKKYLTGENKLYNRKYDYHWSIGNDFDRAFMLTISAYGGSEKRVKHEYEESLMKMLESIPEEMYQYIGPALHASPNMPEKILNMPGIKETKNKFPTRVAPQLKDMENIEFLSPYLYVLLMPEAWPGNYKAIESPRVKRVSPKTEYNPEFYARIRSLVPVDEFTSEKTAKVSDSDLRTLVVTKDSLITSADVKAFVSTIDRVQEFANQPRRQLEFIKAGSLLDMYEQDKGAPVIAGNLKDLVSPCKRMAQKIRLLGLEDEFVIAVGEKGFDLNSWAYTCDKTINAYRLATIKTPMVAAIKSYRQGLYESYRKYWGDENAEQQLMVMQSVSDMYNAPLSDMLEVKKNQKALADKFRELGYSIGGAPVAVY